MGTDEEAVFYSRWDGSSWSTPVDIFFTYEMLTGEYFPGNVWIPMVATDYLGRVHISWTDTYHLFYGWAWINSETWKSTSWFGPSIVVAEQIGPYSDIAVDSEGTIHIVYCGLPDSGAIVEGGNLTLYHDAFHVRSMDRGETWSEPVNLYPSPLRDNRIRLTIDDDDILHVAWDANNASDNQNGLESWERGVYIRSIDRGLSWEEPQQIVYDGVVRYPKTIKGLNGSMLMIWTGARAQKWSLDSGASWSAPIELPAPKSREGSEVSLDAATDADGVIHLVVAGYNQDTEENDIYHLTWDGQDWSNPLNISHSPGLESVRPKIAVSLGNTLHAIWEEWELTEPGNWNSVRKIQVFHSVLETSAAAVPRMILPTPSVTIIPLDSEVHSMARIAEPTNTPTLTVLPRPPAIAPEESATGFSQGHALMLGLMPLTVLLAAVVFVWSCRTIRHK